MDKLSELLKVLKDNNLNKTYDRVMTDIADIKSALFFKSNNNMSF